METATAEEEARREADKDELLRLIALKVSPGDNWRGEFKTDLMLGREIEKLERKLFGPQLKLKRVETTTTERGTELIRCNGCGCNVLAVEKTVGGRSFCSECVFRGRHEWPRWRCQEYQHSLELSELADRMLEQDPESEVGERLRAISTSWIVRFDRRMKFVEQAKKDLDKAESASGLVAVISELLDNI